MLRPRRAGAAISGAPASLATLAALLASSIGLLVGCGPSEEHVADRQLYEAIARLRDDTEAGTAQRRLQLADVEKVATRSAVASEAKAACATAYRQLLDAEDAIAMAEAQMKAAGAAQAVPDSAVAEVARAEQLLDRAKKAMPACDAAAARLALIAR